MSMNNPYAVTSGDIRVAALADIGERSEFIKRTYLHLGGAIIGFVLLEALLFADVGTGAAAGPEYQPLDAAVADWRLCGCGLGSALVAESDASPALQYVGLGLYVVAEAIIIAPLLYIATLRFGSGLPISAGIITSVVFLGLTAFTFMSRADFSWMGRILWIAVWQ